MPSKIEPVTSQELGEAACTEGSLRASAPVHAPAVRPVEGLVEPVDVLDLAPDREAAALRGEQRDGAHLTVPALPVEVDPHRLAADRVERDDAVGLVELRGSLVDVREHEHSFDPAQVVKVDEQVLSRERSREPAAAGTVVLVVVPLVMPDVAD